MNYTFSPFYGEEFTGEIPKKFRYLSVQLYEASQNKSKVSTDSWGLYLML